MHGLEPSTPMGTLRLNVANGDIVTTGAIEFLISVAACAALLVASSAGAANYTLVGKFTSNRGKASNVPLVGLTPAASAINGCGGLTFMSGPRHGECVASGARQDAAAARGRGGTGRHRGLAFS